VIALDDVRRAAAVLRGVAHRTPVLTSRTLDAVAGASLFLKCESFQRTGSFKFRGAFNLMASLPEGERAGGVCTVSSGNHAQAVALAARELGIPAVVAMPGDTPAAKMDATTGYGAEVVTFDRYVVAQREAGARLQAERELPFVSSHDDPRISAGAGTAMLELVEDTGSLDAVVAPVGGGGGLAGYATVATALCHGVRVVAAEPDASRILSRSLAAGRRVELPVPRTIADGQQLGVLGRFPFEVLRRLVDETVSVADTEIVDAMRLLFDRLKLVVEPSGAIALAAALSGRSDLAGRRVGIIVSGGNVGADRFCDLLADGATRAPPPVPST